MTLSPTTWPGDYGNTISDSIALTTAKKAGHDLDRLIGSLEEEEVASAGIPAIRRIGAPSPHSS